MRFRGVVPIIALLLAAVTAFATAGYGGTAPERNAGTATAPPAAASTGSNAGKDETPPTAPKEHTKTREPQTGGTAVPVMAATVTRVVDGDTVYVRLAGGC